VPGVSDDMLEEGAVRGEEPVPSQMTDKGERNRIVRGGAADVWLTKTREAAVVDADADTGRKWDGTVSGDVRPSGAEG
jgi:hypothetical protein